MPFLVGESVGPYKIVQQLGQGGMATVYKAYHAALDRYVALKAMHPAFMEDPGFLARFQREAQVVARLDHPNIVPIYDFAEHEKRPYLVMKFIEGETLKARLARGGLQLEEVLVIVETVSAALAHAHVKGILHRDIKPSNVLLARDGLIFLTDFGLARIAAAGASTLSSDMMLGTPQYISPEQAMGKQDLDERTDIYSFGVMIYEMVAGQVPFSADTPYSIIHDHIYTPLPLPRSINANVSEEIERVLLKALAKEREDRFASVAALGDAFRQAVLGEAGKIGSVPDQKSGLTGEPELSARDLAPSPVSEDIGPGGSDGSTAGSQFKGESPSRAPESGGARTRRQWRWWYGLPLLAGLCLCGLLILSLTQNRPGISAGVGESQASEQATVSPGDPSAEAPQIAEARRVVGENPEDPFAYLALAAAYLDIGDLGAAIETMDAAEGLAGGVSPDFYLAAGDLLIEREQWYLAATMYLRYTRVTDPPVPADVRDRMEGAVYLAAEDPRTAELLENAGEPSQDELQLLLETIRARQNLFQGRIPLAQVAVSGILRREPDYPPALLLQAEIHRARGETAPAVEILESLTHMETQHWVSLIAESLLVEIREG